MQIVPIQRQEIGLLSVSYILRIGWLPHTKMSDSCFRCIVSGLQLRNIHHGPAHARRGNETPISKAFQLVPKCIRSFLLLPAPDLTDRLGAVVRAVEIRVDNLVEM